MALNLETKYGVRANAADADYPYGSIKDKVGGVADTGTPVEADIMNDWVGLSQKLLSEAEIIPSGAPDNVTSSQYYNAMTTIFPTKTELAAAGGSGLVGYQQAGAGSVLRDIDAKVDDIVSVKDKGADSTGAADTSAAFTSADTDHDGIFVPAGLYKISSNTTISAPIQFAPDAKLSVDSGVTLTLNGAIIAGLNQEIFSGAGNVALSAKVYSINWYDTVAQAIRSAKALDNLIINKSLSFSGITIDKNLNFVGIGREYLEITGSHTLSGTGGNSTFNGLHFKTPSVGTTLVTVSGVGGMNYRDCQLNPGTGNLMFDWDRDGTTPQICELMQTKFISGKLCKAEDAGTANTYTFHVKESSLFSSTEIDLLNPVGGNFLVLAIYNSLANIGHAQVAPNDNIQLKFLAGSTIDDNTTNVAWFDNNAIGFDVLEISANSTLSFDSAPRFLGVAPYYAGAGVGASLSNWKTVPSTNLETFNPDLFDEVFYEGTATALTFVQSWVFSAGSGRFKGQRFRLHIVGSIPTGGNNVVVFGRTFNPASNDMKGLRVEGVYDGASWVCSYSDLI